MTATGMQLSPAQELSSLLERMDMAIGRLTRSPLQLAPDKLPLIRMICEQVAGVVPCTRVSLWRMSRNGTRLNCLNCFDSNMLTHSADLVLPRRDHPTLFASMEAHQLDIRRGRQQGPLAWEFDAYMELQNLHRILALPLPCGDTPPLLMLLESSDPERNWLPSERRAATCLASLSARCIPDEGVGKTTDHNPSSQGYQFDQVVDFLPDPTFIINTQGVVTAWNDAMEQMTGISKDLILGHGEQIHAIALYGNPRPMLIDLVLKSDPIFENSYLHFKRVGDTLHGEGMVHCHKSGGQIIVRGSARPLYDAEGKICGAIETLHDISALKEAERKIREANEALEDRVRERTTQLEKSNRKLVEEIASKARTQRELEESEARFRRVVNALPEVVFELDLDGRILMLNTEGLNRSGLAQADLAQAVFITDFIAPGEVENLKANWQKILQGQPLSGAEYTFIGKHGKSFRASAYSHLVAKEQGRTFVAGFLVDETPKIQAREALEKAHTELEQRVEERTHELAKKNDALQALISRQEININLASQVLSLVNSCAPRNQILPRGKNLHLGSLLLPKEKEGGDHFFSRTLNTPNGGRTLISLKDQSGHEVGCILRSIITDLFHNSLIQAFPEASLEEICTRLNERLCESGLFNDGEYLTAILLEFQHETGLLRYLCAGHPPLLLLRDNRASLFPAKGARGANLPLGMIREVSYEAGEFPLQTGDQLLAYTDGLLDLPLVAQKPSLRPEDLQEQMQALLNSRKVGSISHRCEQLLGKLAPPIHTSKGDAPHLRPDDLSLLGLEIEDASRSKQRLLQPRNIQDLAEQRRELLAEILRTVHSRKAHVDPAKLGMVLEEALCNAWKHGNKQQPGQSIEVHYHLGNDLVIDIRDSGTGFNPAEVADPTRVENRGKPSGRGLFMIRRFSDGVCWLDKGRQLRIAFSLGGALNDCHHGSRYTGHSLWT